VQVDEAEAAFEVEGCVSEGEWTQKQQIKADGDKREDGYRPMSGWVLLLRKKKRENKRTGEEGRMT